MATLPSSLALTSIADGALAVAADHRNNNTAIQTEANALLTILGAGSAGDVFTGVGTTVAYAKPPGYEYANTALSSSVAVSATTDATANQIVAASAVTFDGATAVIVEFFAPKVTPGSDGRLLVVLYENGASIGRLADIQLTSTSTKELYVRRRLTPPAGSDTYSVNAFVTAGTGAVAGGIGGSGVLLPGFIRITKA